jgi:hypothetical protein
VAVVESQAISAPWSENQWFTVILTQSGCGTVKGFVTRRAVLSAVKRPTIARNRSAKARRLSPLSTFILLNDSFRRRGGVFGECGKVAVAHALPCKPPGSLVQIPIREKETPTGRGLENQPSSSPDEQAFAVCIPQCSFRDQRPIR